MIEKVDSKDFFLLTPEERINIIEEGVDMLLIDCAVLSKKYKRNLTKVINETIYNIELNKIIEEENENYELCYFYEELVWGVHRRLDKIKKHE